MTAKTMSLAEFSRYRKVSSKTGSTWKKAGLLVWIDGMVHVEASDAILDSRPGAYRGGRTNTRPADSGAEDMEPVDLANAMDWPLAEAIRRKEIALALTRELMLAKAKGELVLRDHVQPAWARIVLGTRNAMLAIPSNLKLKLPHLSTQDIEVIDKTIKAALTAAAMTDEPPPIAGE